MSLRDRLRSAATDQAKETGAALPETTTATPVEPIDHTKAPPGGMTRTDYQRLFKWLQEKMGQGIDRYSYQKENPVVMKMLRERYDVLTQKAGINFNPTEAESVFDSVANEIVGFGPIQPLLERDDISEVMVNGPKQIYIESNGKLQIADVTFEDNDHIMKTVERIVRPLGRFIDINSPMVDARLPDGSRVNAIIPPCAIDGPTLTIRKFGKAMTIDDLIRFGTMSPQIAEFMEACIVARLNTVVSGGTGSGKTTLLNVLSSFIPKDERIVTIEDSAELQLIQPHVVRLEAKPPDRDGRNAVSIRDLVKNSLRMRPERIIIGEVRGGEAIDMLQAMNTGHDGSLATLHANSPREAVSRIETMGMMAGLDLPVMVIRDQISRAVDLIVQQTRLRDGSRKITFITEVSGMEGENVVMTDIFVLEEDGKGGGEIKPTGIRPFFGPRLEHAGFKLKPELFGASISDILGKR